MCHGLCVGLCAFLFFLFLFAILPTPPNPLLFLVLFEIFLIFVSRNPSPGWLDVCLREQKTNSTSALEASGAYTKAVSGVVE